MNKARLGAAVFLLMGVLGSGCGAALVTAGAEIAADSLRGGTSSMAAGGRPSGDAIAGVAAGVALMSAGYHVTPPAQRQSTVTPPLWPRPALAPNSPYPNRP